MLKEKQQVPALDPPVATCISVTLERDVFSRDTFATADPVSAMSWTKSPSVAHTRWIGLDEFETGPVPATHTGVQVSPLVFPSQLE